MGIWDTFKNLLIGAAATVQLVQLNEEVAKHLKQDQFTEAIEVAIQACNLARRELGEDNPLYATSINNLAEAYRKKGEYTKAAPLYQQALQINLKAVGEDHPISAYAMGNLAGLYYEMNNYIDAEPLLKRACDILLRTVGKTDPAYALQLHNLATIYDKMGQYTRSEELHMQALDLTRKTKGETHPEIAIDLNNLAVLYDHMGNYSKALQLLRQALEIHRQALGEHHSYTARSLNNLAEMYRKVGNYSNAEPLYQQALRIRQGLLGEEHLDVASYLSNLASLYYDMGKFDAAEPLYRQALTIQRKLLGEANPGIASSLNNLATLYDLQGRYTDAEPLYQQALQIRRTAFGEHHADVATCLHNLAAHYQDRGRYRDAETLLQQTLGIRREVLGESHPYVADSLRNLACLYAAMNHEADALTLMNQAESINDQTIDKVFPACSESQRMAYLKTLRGSFYGFMSLCLSSRPSTNVGAVFDLVLRRKALAVEALAVQRDTILGGKYAALAPKLQELIILRRQIARTFLAGAGKEDAEIYQQRLADWHTRKEQLETQLASQIPEMSLAQKLQAADRHVIAQALPSASTLVEFVRFRIYDFHAIPAQGEVQWKEGRYVAFVLPAGKPDNIQMFDLGDAKEIDKLIATFRKSITQESESTDDRHLKFVLSSLPPSASRHSGVLLRKMIFDPLVTALGSYKQVFLAPDGDLTRLPFEVLPTDEGHCLLDEYQFSYITTGRDVLRFKARSTGHLNPALVVADPDFDLMGSVVYPLEIADQQMQQSVDMQSNLQPFQRLRGTQVEGKQVAALLEIQPLLEEAALEAQIKKCHSPRVLHIATHGFFLPDPKRDPKKPNLGVVVNGRGGSSRLEQLARQHVENPLLRSGLALAGANTWSRGGTLPSEAEDGLLTAEDVSGLDLLDTELVVLSACETGLGEVEIGEGVFGLRRAFVIAGAKTLVMSLWKVPDLQTQELMEEFYRRILQGQPRADALRAAQLAMKAKYTEPYYWGAFICQGIPSPLPR